MPEPIVSINSQLVIANETETGYTWTLASLLGHMLQVSQEMFGSRDLSYTLLGVEFSEGGPQTWYPGNCKHIVIQLGLECINDVVQACYELAHECTHLLSPLGGNYSTVLEEGLATYFSEFYVKQHIGRDYHAGMESYKSACSKVKFLLNIDPDAIKKLRIEQPAISLISKDLILKNYPQVPEEMAESLAEKFIRAV
jgi:hypothetical protein